MNDYEQWLAAEEAKDAETIARLDALAPFDYDTNYPPSIDPQMLSDDTVQQTSEDEQRERDILNSAPSANDQDRQARECAQPGFAATVQHIMSGCY